MGILDKLFKSPPSRDEFARSILEALRRGGSSCQWSYDVDDFHISNASGSHISNASGSSQVAPQRMSLANHYAEHCKLPKEDRAAHIAKIARVALTTGTDLPTDLETARPNLRPKVWLRAMLEFAVLQGQARSGSAKGMATPQYELGSHLVASLVYDLPDAMRSIAGNELEEWGLTYYEALEIARENLERVPYTFAKIGDGLYGSCTGDSYDSCRLLLPSLLEKLSVQGDPVAMIPNRDTLLLTGSDDEQGLAGMLKIGIEAIKQPRPMSIVPLRWDGSDWVDWMPPADHPQQAKFKEFERGFIHGLYEDQRHIVKQIYAAQGKNVFMPSYSAIENQATGEVHTFAMWTKELPTLLPKVDRLAFFTSPQNMLGMASWPDVERVVGHLMTVEYEYPLRYLVHEFPTAAQLKEIGMEPE